MEALGFQDPGLRVQALGLGEAIFLGCHTGFGLGAFPGDTFLFRVCT